MSSFMASSGIRPNLAGIVFVVVMISGACSLGTTIYQLCEEVQNVCCLAEASSTTGCSVSGLSVHVDDCNGNPMPSSLAGCVRYTDRWSPNGAYTLLFAARGEMSWTYSPGGLCSNYGETKKFNVSLIGAPRPELNPSPKSTPHLAADNASAGATTAIYQICEEVQNVCCFAKASSTTGCSVSGLSVHVDDCNGNPMPSSLAGCVGYTDRWSPNGAYTFMSAARGEMSWTYSPGGLCSNYGETKKFNVTLVGASKKIAWAATSPSSAAATAGSPPEEELVV